MNAKLEEFNNYIMGKDIAIIGLGVSNIPLLDYFHGLAANVTVFDNRTADKIEKATLDKVDSLKYEVVLGENSLKSLVRV